MNPLEDLDIDSAVYMAEFTRDARIYNDRPDVRCVTIRLATAKSLLRAVGGSYTMHDILTLTLALPPVNP